MSLGQELVHRVLGNLYFTRVFGSLTFFAPSPVAQVFDIRRGSIHISDRVGQFRPSPSIGFPINSIISIHPFLHEPMKHLLALILSLCFALPTASAKPIEVLVYSATAWYRHPEIPRLNGFLARLGAKHDIKVSISENSDDLKAGSLGRYDVLLFNNSTNLGESVPEKTRKEIIAWFKNGGGIMAMHAGIVQNGTWPELIAIAGCDFDADSEYMEARFVVDPKAEGDPVVAGKKKEFKYTADWLSFNRPVTGLPGVEVLFRLDEKSYTPVRDHPSYVDKKPMGPDHPICWRRKMEKGRYLFTGLGHDIRSIDTDFARAHLVAAIQWTAGAQKVKKLSRP